MVTSLVSICIPTYNRAGVVSKAIDSALSQSYPNIEVIVVDDGSIDDIEAVIAGYNDKRLLFFKNKRNLGQFGNFNQCIELSKGEYIHILHSDDYIDSNFTKTCVDFMEKHSNVKMTCGAAWILSKNNRKKMEISNHNIIYRAPDGFRTILENGNPIICPSVMMKREVYDSFGLYSCEYPFAGDFYHWLKISRKIDFAFIAKAILYYNEGNHSETFKYLHKTPIGYIDIIKVYIQIIIDLGDEVQSYRRELNISIREHMYLCINTMIWQPNPMKSFSPLIFIGFALNLWTLIKSFSFSGRINKFFDLLYIIMIGILSLLPRAGSIFRKLLVIKQVMKLQICNWIN